LLNFLALLFPSIRKLVEINKTQKKLLNYQKYTTIKWWHRDDPAFIKTIGELWAIEELQWFMQSFINDTLSKMIMDEKGKGAEAYKNKIEMVNIIIQAFQAYGKRKNEIQVLQT